VPQTIPPLPPREDLLKLAQAAIANAGDLLADARTLAEAGRFPRAHALAALACEELGKEHQCLRAVWLPPAPKAFWNGFTRHTDKLSHTHAQFMLHSDEPLASPDLFNTRVHELTRLAHQRKLRGLYVDYEDGALQIPGHITEREAWQLIRLTQEELDREKAEWDEQLFKAQWLSQFSPRGRCIWVMFIYWAVYTHPDTMMPALRDGTAASALVSLAPKFEQAFQEALASSA
jgi:AbiV family abortive infection protein